MLQPSLIYSIIEEGKKITEKVTPGFEYHSHKFGKSLSSCFSISGMLFCSKIMKISSAQSNKTLAVPSVKSFI